MNNCTFLAYLDTDPVFGENAKGIVAYFAVKIKNGPSISAYQLNISVFRLGAEFIRDHCKKGDLLFINGALYHDKQGNLFIRAYRIDNLNLQMPNYEVPVTNENTEFVPPKMQIRITEQNIKPVFQRP